MDHLDNQSRSRGERRFQFKLRRRNPVAESLESSEFSQKVVSSKKHERREDQRWRKEVLDELS